MKDMKKLFKKLFQNKKFVDTSGVVNDTEASEQVPKTSAENMSVTDIARLSVRVFKTKPTRTILTIMGISVGIATVLFLVSLGYGLQYILIGKLVTTEDSLITLDASYPTESNLTINKEKLEQIASTPRAEEVSPVADFSGEIKVGDTTGLVGTKVVEYNYFRLSGLKPDIGSAFKKEDPGIVITSQVARLLGLDPRTEALNKEVEMRVYFENVEDLTYEEIDLTRSLPIRGVIDDDSLPPVVYIPMEYMESPPPFFRGVLVKAETIDFVEEIRDKLTDEGLLISARVDLVRQARKLTNIFTTVLGVFGVTALVISFIGMLNTMIIGFMERIYEVGVMKSLGATDFDIQRIFLAEAFMMGFLGGVLGIIIGILGGEGFNLILNILATKYGGEPFDLFITPIWFVIFVLVTSSLIGLISGFLPAHRSTKLSPKEAFIRR